MNVVERKNTYLSKLKSKEWDIDKFLIECGKWAMEIECWVDFEVRKFPVMIPQAYQEYLDLPFEKRVKTPPEFFHQHSIREYIEMRGQVYAKNFADYSHLQDIKKYLPDNEENLQDHLKLDAKIFEYKNWFNNTDEKTERVKKIFESQ